MLDASTQARLVARIEACRERTGAGVPAISHDAELLGRWSSGNVHAWRHRPARRRFNDRREESGAAGRCP